MISKTFLRKFTTSNVGGLLNPTHPRYSGVRTLLRAPYESDLKKVDIGLIGVPFGKRFFFLNAKRQKKVLMWFHSNRRWSDKSTWCSVRFHNIFPRYINHQTHQNYRYGPNEVRNSSDLVRTINQATKISPHTIENLKVRDVGDAVVTAPFRLEESHEEIERAFDRLCRNKVFPLAVGGDHSVSLPILRALRKHSYHFG